MRRCVHIVSLRNVLRWAVHPATIEIPRVEPHAQPPGARCTSHFFASSSQARHEREFERQESTCWSCSDHYKRGGLVCRACDKIQPVDSSLTYFELLGYREPRFDIDPDALEKRYKLLQWQLHPDKAAGRTSEEKEFSNEAASSINQAYGVLRRPLARANYLLMLKGRDATEGTIADPELLMEVMEAREEVDATDDPDRLRAMLDANRERQGALVSDLGGAFRAGDDEAAMDLTNQLTYLERIEQAITQKL